MDIRLHLRVILIALALFVALGADTADTGDSDDSGGCGSSSVPPLLEDPSFDLWCGDELCSWEVEQGNISQVPTWHSGDHGVGLHSDPTILSQHSPGSDEDTDCILFTLMVDSDPGVTVQLELDFQDDGLTEYAHPIPSTDWETFSYYIRPPSWFDHLRFRIRKTGTGNATVAQIAADRADGDLCGSQTPTPYRDLPLANRCEADSECSTGICKGYQVLSSDAWLQGHVRATCGECNVGGCGEEQVCGLSFTADNQPHSACVEPASKSMGEACTNPGECGTGVCCEGRCSECCQTGNNACDDDATCAPAHGNNSAPTWMMPYMCDGGDRDRGNGEACIRDADCSSRTCGGQGEIKLCDPSGQPCETSADCPAYDGEPATCRTVGPRDGACLLDDPPWPGIF